MRKSEPEIDENIVKCGMRITAPKQHGGGKVFVILELPITSGYYLVVANLTLTARDKGKVR